MRTFVSAGWPYLYDVPGLHNCVPMLFADVYARYLRSRGEEVFFLCGGDEHGSRIEFVARGLRKRPQDLIDEKYQATVPLLAEMGISVDVFGRTSDPAHGRRVRELLSRLKARGKAFDGLSQVAYCSRCAMHLPDRFVQGRCPRCGDITYGGQCGNKKTCGRMIESLDDGSCALCSSPIEFKSRKHLLFPLSSYAGSVLPHIRSDGQNEPEVLRRVSETFRDVPEAALTRDTPWGIALEGEEVPERTIYSWVDSLLAKVSMAPAAYWNDDSVRRLFFLGMDGVPFYGALLPSLLLAADEGYSIGNWSLLPNEVLIYEGGVCSKSTGTGIWLKEALAVLDGDFWRFHVYDTYARAEKHADFRWESFARSIDSRLRQDLGGNVERAAAGSSAGAPDLDRIERAQTCFSALDTAGAFRETMDLVTDPHSSRATLLESMPLLACFVPRVAEKARRRLAGDGPPVFADRVPSSQELRSRYQARVDERMDRQTLEEEVTNLRADTLCVCPIDLEER